MNMVILSSYNNNCRYYTIVSHLDQGDISLVRKTGKLSQEARFKLTKNH